MTHRRIIISYAPLSRLATGPGLSLARLLEGDHTRRRPRAHGARGLERTRPRGFPCPLPGRTRAAAFPPGHDGGPFALRGLPRYLFLATLRGGLRRTPGLPVPPGPYSAR